MKPLMELRTFFAIYLFGYTFGVASGIAFALAMAAS